MHTDVKIKNADGNFKLRVCPVLCLDGRFLISSVESPFFSFPGGHVELGETTEEALLRETFEETGLEIKINNLLCIMQNIWGLSEGKIYHEVAYYYTVSIKDKTAEAKFLKDFKNNILNFERTENDKGVIKTIRFAWKTLDELKQIDFRPAPLLDMLDDLKSFKAIIHKKV